MRIAPNQGEKRLVFNLSSQPTETTCGPSCLHGVYQFYGDTISLDQVIEEVPVLDHGGTLAVHLGTHALARGYKVRIYTFNLNVFDPTWFNLKRGPFCEKLRERAEHHSDKKLKSAAEAYLNFLQKGGRVEMKELVRKRLRKYLDRNIPIITGLSSTWLYRAPREDPMTNEDDDVRGEPSGHFVTLCGYNRSERKVYLADPFTQNPTREGNYYSVCMDRLMNSILMGVLTYDANLLIIRKK